MEEVIFFKEDIIATEVIFFHILSNLFFGQFVKLLNDRVRDVGNNFF